MSLNALLSTFFYFVFLRSCHCYIAEERVVLKAMYLGMQVELFRLFSLKQSFLIYINPVFRKKGYQDIMSYIILLFCKLSEIALEHMDYFHPSSKRNLYTSDNRKEKKYIYIVFFLNFYYLQNLCLLLGKCLDYL